MTRPAAGRRPPPPRAHRSWPPARPGPYPLAARVPLGAGAGRAGTFAPVHRGARDVGGVVLAPASLTALGWVAGGAAAAAALVAAHDLALVVHPRGDRSVADLDVELARGPAAGQLDVAHHRRRQPPADGVAPRLHRGQLPRHRSRSPGAQ